MHTISSDSNALFRSWLRVATTPRAAREAGFTLAEGLHLAQAALAAGAPVTAAILRRASRHAEVEVLLGELAPEVRRYELAPALYERLAPVEQGAGILLALALPENAMPRQSTVDMVYLDGVQDPGNVGAIVRSAAAAGVGHVLAGPGTAALWSPKVLRAAMGAHFRIGLHERVAPQRLADALAGPWIAAVAHDAPPLWGRPLPAGAIGWVFGAEGAGPSAAALAACAERRCIPTSGAVESLNVAAAAAICLFERRRQVHAAQR